MLPRSTLPIAAIATRTTEDSFRPGFGAGTGAGGSFCIGSALNRLAAFRAEFHVPRGFVPVRTLDRLGRAAFAAELQARRDGLAALHARLPDRRRVRAAGPAELHVHRVVRAALRARLDLLLGRGLHHAGDLGAHRGAHTDPGPEAKADARGSARWGLRR